MASDVPIGRRSNASRPTCSRPMPLTTVEDEFAASAAGLFKRNLTSKRSAFRAARSGACRSTSLRLGLIRAGSARSWQQRSMDGGPKPLRSSADALATWRRPSLFSLAPRRFSCHSSCRCPRRACGVGIVGSIMHWCSGEQWPRRRGGGAPRCCGAGGSLRRSANRGRVAGGAVDGSKPIGGPRDGWWARRSSWLTMSGRAARASLGQAAAVEGSGLQGCWRRLLPCAVKDLRILNHGRTLGVGGP